MSAISQCVTIPLQQNVGNASGVRETAVWRQLTIELREIKEALQQHPDNTAISELLKEWVERLEPMMRLRHISIQEVIDEFRRALGNVLTDPLLVTDRPAPLAQFLLRKMESPGSLFFSQHIKEAIEAKRQEELYAQVREIDALCAERMRQVREATSSAGSLIERIRQFSQQEQAEWDAIAQDAFGQLSETENRIHRLRERIAIRREEKRRRIEQLQEEVRVLKQEIREQQQEQKTLDHRIEAVHLEQQMLRTSAHELEIAVERKKDEALQQLACTIAIAAASWGIGQAIGAAAEASGNTIGLVWKI